MAEGSTIGGGGIGPFSFFGATFGAAGASAPHVGAAQAGSAQAGAAQAGAQAAGAAHAGAQAAGAAQAGAHAAGPQPCFAAGAQQVAGGQQVSQQGGLMSEHLR